MSDRQDEGGRWSIGVLAGLAGAVLGAGITYATTSMEINASDKQRRDEALSSHQAALLRYQFALQAVSEGNRDGDDDGQRDGDVVALLDEAQTSAIEAAVTYKVASAYLDENDQMLQQCAGSMQDRLWNLTSIASKGEVTVAEVDGLLSYGGSGLGLSPDEKVWETLDSMGTAIGSVRRAAEYNLATCPQM